jgi:endonuclease III
VKKDNHYAPKFSALLRQLRKKFQPKPLPRHDPVTQLVLAFLEWDASPKQAEAAHQRLMSLVVDNNDLRVSHPDEVVAVIGERYPKAAERAHRLREALQDIFIREHAVSLEGLGKRSKKEIHHYLASLKGVTPYVAAQVMLLCFDVHAVPVDEPLARLLKKEGVVDAEASVEAIQGFLERHVKAAVAVEVHAVLRAWVDAAGSRGASAGGVVRSGSTRAGGGARRSLVAAARAQGGGAARRAARGSASTRRGGK